MSNLSCVPAIILLNGALQHYGLKMCYFHLEKAKDELLSICQRARMSQQIRLLIPEPKKDELEKKFAKENRKRIGYTRAQVLNTTHKNGQKAANDYIDWYNHHRFDHLPEITGVRKTEVTNLSTIPQIGLKYPELRPAPVLPDNEASEPEVEDESPSGSNKSTTGGEGSPPAVTENLPTKVKTPKTTEPHLMQGILEEYLLQEQPRNERVLLLRKLIKDLINDQLGHRLLKHHCKSTRLQAFQ